MSYFQKKFSNQLKWITANRPPSLFFWGLPDGLWKYSFQGDAKIQKAWVCWRKWNGIRVNEIFNLLQNRNGRTFDD